MDWIEKDKEFYKKELHQRKKLKKLFVVADEAQMHNGMSAYSLMLAEKINELMKRTLKENRKRLGANWQGKR